MLDQDSQALVAHPRVKNASGLLALISILLFESVAAFSNLSRLKYKLLRLL